MSKAKEDKIIYCYNINKWEVGGVLLRSYKKHVSTSLDLYEFLKQLNC